MVQIPVLIVWKTQYVFEHNKLFENKYQPKSYADSIKITHMHLGQCTNGI